MQLPPLKPRACVTSLTPRPPRSANACLMDQPRIAVCVPDEDLHAAIALTFDAAPSTWRVAFFDFPPPDADVVVSAETGADVGLEPIDQLIDRIAQHLQRPRRGRLIAVTGATGGCGTTTIALHLTRLMTGAVYLESDPLRRTAADRFGIDGPTRTWDEAEDLRAAALPIEGIRALLAPNGGTLPEGFFDQCFLEFPTVVVEPLVPVSITAGVLVIPATKVGLARATRLAPLLPDSPWAIVLNHTCPDGSIRHDDVQRSLGIAVTVELPYTAQLATAERDGRLIAPGWSRWMRRLSTLARSLEAQ